MSPIFSWTFPLNFTLSKKRADWSTLWAARSSGKCSDSKVLYCRFLGQHWRCEDEIGKRTAGDAQFGERIQYQVCNGLEQLLVAVCSFVSVPQPKPGAHLMLGKNVQVKPFPHARRYCHTYKCSVTLHSGNCTPTSGISIITFLLNAVIYVIVLSIPIL